MVELLQLVGVKYAGGTHSLYRNRIDRLGLDTSHWKGRGPGWNGGFHNKKTADQILVYEPDAAYRQRVSQLRRAMIEIGIPYVCSECGQPPLWNGKPLTLQVDHVNGDNRDSRPHNVRFLCPNCHTQTDTYAMTNRGVGQLGRPPGLGPGLNAGSNPVTPTNGM
jgi:hypothetical protein